MTIQTWLEKHISLHEHDDSKEEKANSLTHLIGAILSLGAFVWILLNAGSFSRPAMSAAAIVYALSMLLLYSASSLYHALPRNNWKRVCRILDHSNIYFLIAGTYTPVFVYLNSPVGRTLVALVWGIAALGVIFTLVFWGKLKPLHVVFYLAMGWMIVFFWSDIIPYMPEGLIYWVIAGGLTYSLGVIFYAMKKLPFYHAVWHLFVLGGSILFFIGFAKKLFM
jgi:hemolysin III